MQIPQCNPLASYQQSKTEIDAAISGVLSRGIFILGEQVAAFEKEFADYHGAGHAVGMANGTDAIELVLRGLGIGAGSKVFTVSHTAVATVSAIERAGAIPILVDIDQRSYTMCPSSLDAAIKQHRSKDPGPHVDAIIVVHLYGQPAPNWRQISDMARNHNLRLVEDCSQAHGSQFGRTKVGTLGDAAAYSLYPTKNLGALGDGGICLTRDADLAGKLKGLREYGWTKRYVSEFSGANSRLDELQAAILRIKLKRLDRDNELRRSIANIYLSGIDNPRLTLPAQNEFCRHVYHQFVIRTKERDGLRRHLTDHGIGTLVHYPVPIHLQPAYHGRVPLSPLGLRQTEQAANEIVSLPMFPEMATDSVDKVVSILNNWTG